MAEKDFEATIKKLNKKLEEELERKYAKLLGNNSKALSNAAKKEVKRITEKIHRKIVASGNKEIQNIVSVYEETIKSSRKTLEQLSQKLKDIDSKTDALKKAGKLKPGYVNDQAQRIDRKIKDIQSHILIQEQEKEKAVRSYIGNNVKIQQVEQQSLELNLKALTSSRLQRLRVLELQDRIAKAEIEKQKSASKGKPLFGDFRSTIGENLSHHGFGFKQERALVKGLFSPITNLFQSIKKTKEDKDRNELNLLLDSLKNNSEIYQDVASKLNTVIPSLPKLIESKKIHDRVVKNKIPTIKYDASLPLIKSFVTEKSQSYGSVFDLNKSGKETDQVKEIKLSNMFLGKILKVLQYASDAKKTDSSLLSSTLKSAGLLAAAFAVGSKLLTSVFARQFKILSNIPRVVNVLGRRTLRNAVRSPSIKRISGSAKSVAVSVGNSLIKSRTFSQKIGSSLSEIPKKAKSIVTSSSRTINKFRPSKSMLGRIGKASIRRIPILGGAVTGGLNYATTGSVTRAVSSGLGSTAGTAVGASLGAVIGSVIPVIGTAVGGIVGGIVGDVIGTAVGDKLGKNIESMRSSNEKTYLRGDLEHKKMEMSSADSTSVSLEQPHAVKLVSTTEEGEKDFLSNFNVIKTFLKDDFSTSLASKIADQFKSGSDFPIFAADSHRGAFGGRG